MVEDIKLKGHNSNKADKIYKYKIEYNKDRSKVSKMQETLRTDILKDMRFYNWKLISDVEDNNFKPLVDKIMYANQSYFITGPGGSGKTTLLKQLQAELTIQDKKYITFCPSSIIGWWYDYLQVLNQIEKTITSRTFRFRLYIC